MKERIQKILSQWGIASRRQAEKMIIAGRVSVNGKTVSLGDKADINRDKVEVDGRVVKPSDRPEPIYLLLNKPKGYVCTCKDPQHRPTILNLLPKKLTQGQGIHPVGRLDVDSTGAILLTNDGALTLNLTHPRYHLPKTYLVWVSGCLTFAALNQWRKGVMLDGKLTLPAKVQVIQQDLDKTRLKIILQEGRNRQIRRVAQQLGYPVLDLHRTAIGPVKLKSPTQPELAKGKYRALSLEEINSLKAKI